MRKARRTAEQVQEPPIPYPQYAYLPPDPVPVQQPIYDNMASNQGMYNPPTMGYYPSSAGQPYPQGGNDPLNYNIPSQIFQNPAASIAFQYGSNYIDKSKEVLDKELNKYISSSRIKYYFSVDTSYVFKKLALILFPFTQTDWTVKYNPEEPVQPRFELNAPDLYIPVMAFVTYVLAGGVSLGIQNRFAPELLGAQASTALASSVAEMLIVWGWLYFSNITSKLKILDVLAFTSYKYVGMIGAIVTSFLIPYAYHPALIYFSISIMYFLIRSLKVQILPESASQEGSGTKSRTLLLVIAGIQPLMMWLLTRSLARPLMLSE